MSLRERSHDRSRLWFLSGFGVADGGLSETISTQVRKARSKDRRSFQPLHAGLLMFQGAARGALIAAGRYRHAAASDGCHRPAGSS